MNYQKIILIIIVLGTLISGFIFLQSSEHKELSTIKFTTIEGSFNIEVLATGELDAKKSKRIMGPNTASIGIHRVKISDMITEGTVVKKGDYVATLDRSDLMTKLTDLKSKLTTVESQLEQAKLDTAITLRQMRSDLENLTFNIKEEKLELEQSQFEAPATIRRIELKMERIQRDYKEMQRKYSLKQEQAAAKVLEIESKMSIIKNRYNAAIALGDKFIIKAPQDGMLIYARSWNGKIGPGSQIQSWDPTVAKLPDMSTMISKTYINEVDIAKVKVNQRVELKVDAFPDKIFQAKVNSVANVGEELPTFDAKVFEVTIELLNADSLLRPGMSTSSVILVEKFDSVIYVPIESVFNTDSLIYVIIEDEKNQLIRQEVITGKANSNHLIIKEGLKANTKVLLNQVTDLDKYPINYLSDEIKEIALQKAKMKALKAKQAKAKAAKRMDALLKEHDAQSF